MRDRIKKAPVSFTGNSRIQSTRPNQSKVETFGLTALQSPKLTEMEPLLFAGSNGKQGRDLTCTKYRMQATGNNVIKNKAWGAWVAQGVKHLTQIRLRS